MFYLKTSLMLFGLVLLSSDRCIIEPIKTKRNPTTHSLKKIYRNRFCLEPNRNEIQINIMYIDI